MCADLLCQLEAAVHGAARVARDDEQVYVAVVLLVVQREALGGNLGKLGLAVPLLRVAKADPNAFGRVGIELARVFAPHRDLAGTQRRFDVIGREYLGAGRVIERDHRPSRMHHALHESANNQPGRQRRFPDPRHSHALDF